MYDIDWVGLAQIPIIPDDFMEACNEKCEEGCQEFCCIRNSVIEEYEWLNYEQIKKQ